MECDAVTRELEKVLGKSTSLDRIADQTIAESEDHIRQLQQELATLPPDEPLSEAQIQIVKDSLLKVKNQLYRIATDHREMHSSVSKVGKVIDRNFINDFTETSRSELLDDEPSVQVLNKLIALHYQRQGMDDVVQALIKESGINIELESANQFAEIYRIYEAINKNELAPALKWVADHSKELDAKNSGVEFKLHRLAFLQVLTSDNNSPVEAIAYARTHLSKFVGRFEKDIQILMGTLLYIRNGIYNSPYKHLVSHEMWVEAAESFLRDACLAVGIEKDSPLGVVVNSGCTALPALLSLNLVMASRHVYGVWGNRDELPIEIDLDPEHRYHSIFACPILRQQSTEENPPMRLSCGHVISRDALNKLSGSLRMSAARSRLKCPYCPMEQSPLDAKQVYF